MQNYLGFNQISPLLPIALSNNGLSLNTYVNGLFFSFIANQSKTISSIAYRITGKTGTPGNTDIPVYLVKPFMGAPYKICVCTNGAATITLNGNRLANGDRILMFGTTLPTGASARGTLYYVINAATNTFNLSLTEGGSAITWSSTGTNVCFARYLDIATMDMSSYTGGAWYSFTGFSTALTEGNQYFLLFTNHNATPASNYITVSFIYNISPSANPIHSIMTTNLTTQSVTYHGTAFNGSIYFSDGAEINHRFTGGTVTTAVLAQNISTTVVRVGVRYKTPLNAKIRIKVAAFGITTTISATTIFDVGYVANIRNDSDTIIATSQTIYIAQFGTSAVRYVPFTFTDVVILEPDTIYRIEIMSVTSNSSNANRLTVTGHAIDAFDDMFNDGNGNALYFLGSYSGTLTAITTESSNFYKIQLIPDDANPYESVGGSGDSSYSFAY